VEQITWNGVGSVKHPTSAGGIPVLRQENLSCERVRAKRSNELDTNAKRAHDRAELAFKKEQQLREGQQAMAEYEAACAATREKTARLRALRLARDAGLTTPLLPAAAKAADLIVFE
jgi:hypothetical protein